MLGALVTDNWDPSAGVGDVPTFKADFRVAAHGGTHTSVQAAIDAAVTAGRADRVYVEVSAGTYREVVCVPVNAPPLTLYSRNPDARATVIVYDNYNGKPKAAGEPANPCSPNSSATSYGTSGSATATVLAANFHAKNITFSNDTDESSVQGGKQAVALMTQGDKVVLENVRLLGNQDTFYARTPTVDTVTRAYVTRSYVEGDVDFIFGRATLIFDKCTIHFLSTRQGSGYVVAPSTDARNPYGILIVNGRFTADAGTKAGQVFLGRAWDESQRDVTTYATNVAGGVYPNGQALVRESTLGAHIRRSGSPWADAATTKRSYNSLPGTLPANRLYEYANVGPGSSKPGRHKDAIP